MDLRTLKDNASEHFRRGRFAKAADAYLELCRKEPREAQHRIKLGDSYRRDGRRDKAVEAYREAALAYAEQGVVIKAIAACKLVLELDPEDREAQESLATLCTKRYVRSASAPAPYVPAARPEVQTPSSRYAPIELPDDDGSVGALETAGGDVIDAGEDERALPPLAASRPPPEEEPRVRPPPPVVAPDLPRISPHGGGGIELDLGSDAPASPPAPPSRAPAPPPPSWQAQSTPVDDGGIELDLGGPPASEPVGTPVGRRGRSYDLSSLNEPSFPAAHEPELLAEDLLEPLEELEPEELEAELVPSAPPRTSDALALNVAAQSVADMLSDSLLVEGGTDDGYEVELLSVTASMPAWQAGPAAGSHQPAEPMARRAAPETVTPSRQVPVVFRPEAPDRSASSAEPASPAFASSDSELLHGSQMANEAFELADPSAYTSDYPSAYPSDDVDGPSLAAEVDQSSVPLFNELPREAFLELLQRLTFRRHSPGDVVLREGDSGRSIFVLASGRLRVVKALDELDEVELATLDEGAFFGEMALLNGAPRVASVVAVDECETLEITEELLQELVSRYPPVARSLKKFYRQRLLANVMAMAPIFRSLDRRDRRALLERFKLREVSAGHVVCKEGEANDGLYVVMHGRMQVSRTKEDGSTLALAVLREGDVFGEASLLARSGANASVAAIRKTLLLRLPRSDFNELISTHPTVLEVLSTLADARERETEEIVTGARPPPDDESAA